MGRDVEVGQACRDKQTWGKTPAHQRGEGAVRPSPPHPQRLPSHTCPKAWRVLGPLEREARGRVTGVRRDLRRT